MPRYRPKFDVNFYRYRDICATKRQFKNEAEALEAAEFRMLENMTIDLTVYHCLVCNHWHLTRQVDRKQK